jgi:SAM-dependent MidA family methyltransferase
VAPVLTQLPLPPPTAAEAAQSARVADEIRARIAAAGGWLPFSAFMDAALYAPGLGYYVTERPVFGAPGDFVTAPELSPLFAACVANCVAALLARAGGGDVLEFGAGSGRFAGDVFECLLRLEAPVRRYRIVEPSPAFTRRQQALLAAAPACAPHAERFEWLAAPPREPWQGVAFANEVVDALPVDRFRVGAHGVEAIGVAATAGGFEWRPRAAGEALAAAVGALQRELPAPMPAGFVSELRPGQGAWLASATAAMARGALLVVDYGLPRAQYYHASRDGGTLCAFRRHRRVEDVLAHPGIQDLTAWVDFSALADAAAEAGLALGGFATQAHFLVAAGIERELSRIGEALEEHGRLALRDAANRMLLPGEMGERFKAMALVREIEGPIDGFGFRDLSASL